MDKEARSYKNKVYTPKYRTMNPMASPEWLRRGYAFVGQTQEHLKDILKELTLKMRTMTDKEIERDLKKGLNVTGDITSELSRFVRQGLEQKRTFKGLLGTLIETKNLALIKLTLEVIKELKERSSLSSLLFPIAKEILRELQRIQAIIYIKELEQMETSLIDIQYWKLTRHLCM
jgi:hypothetical protein